MYFSRQLNAFSLHTNELQTFYLYLATTKECIKWFLLSVEDIWEDCTSAKIGLKKGRYIKTYVLIACEENTFTTLVEACFN